LKKSWHYGISRKITEEHNHLDSTMSALFERMKSCDHRLFQLLPPQRNISNSLRARGHHFELSDVNYKLHK